MTKLLRFEKRNHVSQITVLRCSFPFLRIYYVCRNHHGYMVKLPMTKRKTLATTVKIKRTADVI